MIANYLRRPYTKATIDPEPSRLALDFLFTHFLMVGMLSLDIETKPHELFAQRCAGMGLTEEQELEMTNMAAVRTDSMEIGVAQFMDSAGQFGYASGENEIEVISLFWSLFRAFPLDDGMPIIVSHNGSGFDLHNLDIRTAFLAAFMEIGDIVPRPFWKDSKYGDRKALPQLDVGACYSPKAGRDMPKLHFLAQNLFLPGKPTQSGRDAVDLFYTGTDEDFTKALEYMIYDVRTPIQIAYLGDILRRQYIAGSDRGANCLQEPFILPPEFVQKPAAAFREPLPPHYSELLTMAPHFPSKLTLLTQHESIQTFPDASPEIHALLGGLREKRRIQLLGTTGFQRFCAIARKQAGLPDVIGAPAPNTGPVEPYSVTPTPARKVPPAPLEFAPLIPGVPTPPVVVAPVDPHAPELF